MSGDGTPPQDDVLARLTAGTGGDPARARMARRALERLRQSEEPELRRLADEVLSGSRSLRSVVQDQTFDRIASERMPRLFEQVDALDEQQRAELLERFEEQRRRDLAGD